MDRRKFLRSGSLAMIAVAALPKAIKAENTQDPTLTYRSKIEPGKAGQWLYEIAIDHNVIEDFKNASDLSKTLILKKAYFETTDLKAPSQQGEYAFVMKKVTASQESLPEWEITTKFDKKMSTDEKLEKGFLKTPKIYIKKLQYVEFRDKSGNRLQNLLYVPPASKASKEGCFLTTACVLHQQLPDDCEALQTLRHLRDQFMINDIEGRELVKQYQLVGPAIVNSINNCKNREEIYEYMYSQMIQPAVLLVKDGNYSEAVEYYKTFVEALMKQYN